MATYSVGTTYDDWLENNTVPSVLDDATATLIEEWFGNRYVTKYFDRYFTRACNLNYAYYRQLLRIDPTISDFDWLVDNYLEIQTNESGTDSETTSSERTLTNQNNEIYSESGSPTKVKTGSLSKNYTNVTDTRNITGSTTDTHSGSDETAYSGSEIGSTHSVSSSENAGRSTAFARNEPMNASYSYSSSSSVWQTSDSGSISLGDEGSTTISANFPTDGFIRPVITNPSSTSDAATQSADFSENGTRSQTEYDGRADTTTYDSSFTGTNQSSESYSHGTPDMTETYNSITETENLAKEYSKSTSSAGSDDVNATKSGENNLLRQSVAAGRNQNIAELLELAKRYIMGSRAWDFLRQQLEPCFLQMYALDDFEEDE